MQCVVYYFKCDLCDADYENGMFNSYIAHFLYGYNQMHFTTLCGGLCQTAPRSSQFYDKVQYDTPVPPDQNT